MSIWSNLKTEYGYGKLPEGFVIERNKLGDWRSVYKGVDGKIVYGEAKYTRAGAVRDAWYRSELFEYERDRDGWEEEKKF